MYHDLQGQSLREFMRLKTEGTFLVAQAHRTGRSAKSRTKRSMSQNQKALDTNSLGKAPLNAK